MLVPAKAVSGTSWEWRLAGESEGAPLELEGVVSVGLQAYGEWKGGKVQILGSLDGEHWSPMYDPEVAGPLQLRESWSLVGGPVNVAFLKPVLTAPDGAEVTVRCRFRRGA